jgi:predicted ABC-type ATPase
MRVLRLRKWARRRLRHGALDDLVKYAARRVGLEPVEREVSRAGGKTHKQIYWVAPDIAKSLKERGIAKEPDAAGLAAHRAGRASDGKPDVPTGKKWSPPAPEPAGLPKFTHTKNFNKNPIDHWDPDKQEFSGVVVTDPKRAAMHAQIIKDALDKVAPTPPEAVKHAILMMGAPATGKSSMLQGTDESKFVKVDPDLIKGDIPEYKTALAGPVVPQRAAYMAHSESSYVAKQIRNEAIASGRPVVVDGTGSDSKDMLGLIRKLKDNGYHVSVLASDLEDTDTAVLRAAERSEREGRVVPEDVQREIHKEVPVSFMKVAADSGADDVTLFDTFDRAPRPVFRRSVDGAVRVHDRAYLDRYAKRGGDPLSRVFDERGPHIDEEERRERESS